MTALRLAIGAVPLLALLALALSGAAAPGPVLLAMLAAAAAALGLARLWTRDLDRIPLALHQVRSLAGRASRAEDALRAEQAILESLSDPVVILDASLRVRRTNAAARREFGPAASTALRHPTLRAAIDRALAEGAPQAIDLMLPVPAPRDLQAAITLLDPQHGGAGRVVVVLTDRTQERALERMRADFVANAGHELRTPLASLIGFIDTLRGPAADDPPAQRRFLPIMAEQAARMHRLIDDLLSLSRIELSEHQRPTGRVDLAAVAAHAADALEPALAARGATVALDLAPGLPALSGDADQLAQVLLNLLDNALKHGGPGVAITLSARPAPDGERWPARPGLVLTVADSGPGIAREHLPRLTERFYRVDPSRSRAAGGTGLGLAIVKHIVNRHHGQLRIDSTVGAGTRFHIWLPTA